MLHASTIAETATPLTSDRSRDYALIRRAIAFLSATWTEQPALERLAEHLGLSPAHCQKLFKRWCGLSPKEFVQAITVDHARGLLGGSASILETAYEVGTYKQGLMPMKGGAVVDDTGKYVVLLKKDAASGTWLITHAIYNSDVPLPAAAPAKK